MTDIDCWQGPEGNQIAALEEENKLLRAALNEAWDYIVRNDMPDVADMNRWHDLANPDFKYPSEKPAQLNAETPLTCADETDRTIMDGASVSDTEESHD